MKRIIAFLLGAIMVFLLCACNSPKDEPDYIIDERDPPVYHPVSSDINDLLEDMSASISHSAYEAEKAVRMILAMYKSHGEEIEI